MRRSITATAALGIVVLALSGCGGDDDDPGSVDDEIKEALDDGNLDSVPDEVGGDPADLPDACELVTAADATDLFGADAEEQADSSLVDFGVSCVYGNSGSNEVGSVGHLLQVSVFDGEQFYDAAAVGATEDVDGLGDRAFSRTGEDASGAVEVQFVQDGKTVTLAYSTVNIGVDDAKQIAASDHEEDVVALARRVSDRM